MKKIYSAGIGLAMLLGARSNALAWGDKGHATVVAIALAGQPQLEQRLRAVLSHMSESAKFQALITATRTSEAHMDPGHRKGAETLISHVQGPQFYGVGTIANAGTWPDHIRSLTGYKANKYDKNHYINLDFEGPSDDPANFAVKTNATIFLTAYIANASAKTTKVGDKAWDLFWICHLVGDLHQPLHCVARHLPSNRPDAGGNSVHYNGATLHHFWDALPETNPAPVDAYAADLIKRLSKSTKAAQIKDLDPHDWVKEGRTAIRAVGYPSDFPVTAQHPLAAHPADVDADIPAYDAAALKVAEPRLVLAGLRLRKILLKLLPAKP